MRVTPPSPTTVSSARAQDGTLPRQWVGPAALDAHVASTLRNQVEIVVPANTGHLYVRFGREVYDFAPQGFRVGAIRPIGNDRYGFVIPLDDSQSARLAAHLQRLTMTAGKELGTYDFQGTQGLHCVSWFTTLPLGSGQSFATLLGATPKDTDDMPAFARFLSRRCKAVRSLVLYSAQAPADLRTHPIDLITLAQLERAARKDGVPGA